MKMQRKKEQAQGSSKLNPFNPTRDPMEFNHGIVYGSRKLAQNLHRPSLLPLLTQRRKTTKEGEMRVEIGFPLGWTKPYGESVLQIAEPSDGSDSEVELPDKHSNDFRRRDLIRNQKHNIQDTMDKGGPRVRDCTEQILEEYWLREVKIDELWKMRRKNTNLVAHLLKHNTTLAPSFVSQFRGWLDEAKADRLVY